MDAICGSSARRSPVPVNVRCRDSPCVAGLEGADSDGTTTGATLGVRTRGCVGSDSMRGPSFTGLREPKGRVVEVTGSSGTDVGAGADGSTSVGGSVSQKADGADGAADGSTSVGGSVSQKADGADGAAAGGSGSFKR